MNGEDSPFLVSIRRPQANSASNSIPPSNHLCAVPSMSEKEKKRIESELRNLKSIVGHSLVDSTTELELSSLVFMVANFDCPLQLKYKSFDFVTMIKSCYRVYNNFDKLMNCLHRLANYGMSLLKVEVLQSNTWRTIYLLDIAFVETVDVIQGSRNVLRTFGYTEERNNCLYFPPPSVPDYTIVVELTLELLSSKMELELFAHGNHCHPELIQEHLLQSSNCSSSTCIVSPVVNGTALKSAVNDNLNNITSRGTIPQVKPSTRSLPAVLPARSSASSVRPANSKASASEDEESKCDICGVRDAEWQCSECDNKMVCTACDMKWHQHQKRRNHQRQQLIRDAASGFCSQTSRTKSTDKSVSVESPGRTQKDQKSFSPLVGPDAKSLPGLHDVAWSIPPAVTDIPGVTLPPAGSSKATETKMQPHSTVAAQKSQSHSYPEVIAKKSQADLSLNSGSLIRSGSINSSGNIHQDTRSVIEALQSEIKELSLISEESQKKVQDFDVTADDHNLILKPNIVDDIKDMVPLKFSEQKQSDMLQTSFGASADNRTNLESGVQSDLSDETCVMNLKLDSNDRLEEMLAQAKYPPSIPIWQSGMPATGVPAKPSSTFNEPQGYFSPTSAPLRADWDMKSLLPHVTLQSSKGMHVTGVTAICGAGQLQFPRQAVQPTKSSNIKDTTRQPTGATLRESEKFSSKNGADASALPEKRFPPNAAKIPETRLSASKEAVGACGGHGHDRAGAVVSRVPGGHLNIMERPPEYRSKFTYIQDEVYREKQEAHARFMQHHAEQHPEISQQLPENVKSSFVQQRGMLDPEIQIQPSNSLSARLLQDPYQMWPLVEPSAKPQPVTGNFLVGQQIHTHQYDASLKLSNKPSSNATKLQSPSLLESLHPVSPVLQVLPLQDRLALLQKEKETIESRINAQAWIRTMKVAEEQGFIPEELRIISELSSSIDSDPYSYRADVWMKSVSQVIEGARARLRFGADCTPLMLGRMSLCQSSGDATKAVDAFVALWDQKIGEVISQCNLPLNDEDRRLESRQRAENELSACHGNEEEAVCNLVKQSLLNNIYANQDVEPTEDIADANMYLTNHGRLDERLMETLKDNSVERDHRVRMVFCEANLQSWQRADYAISLLTSEPPLPDGVLLVDIVEAVRSSASFAECRRFLEKECEICYTVYPSRQIANLPCCQCNVCRDCLQNHFEVVIRERYVRNMVCPVCSQPDIDNSQQTDTYLQLLLILLKDLLSDEVLELFQTKLRDWNLMMEPLFRWCVHADCRCGFVIDAEIAHLKKVTCPSCQRPMCQLCKKVWESQHDNTSCEEFQAWKEANDPEHQTMGLARHLEENGIDCPQCKCRYSLAKGGCMHFTCYQCRHEFCSGCMEAFKHGKQCKKFKSCAKAGLHCHHPRNCLFYLRDYDVKTLQKMLRDHNTSYNTAPPANQQGLAAEEIRCTVMEQKQTQTGFKDEPCGKPVPEDSAGLCEVHYKEYLVGLVNDHNIDPAEIMTDAELKVLLDRAEKTAPKRDRKEDQASYTKRLLQIVQKDLPLFSRCRTLPTAQQVTTRLDVTDGLQSFVSRRLADGLLVDSRYIQTHHRH